jgi:excisionase family DNA binding protein
MGVWSGRRQDRQNGKYHTVGFYLDTPIRKIEQTSFGTLLSTAEAAAMLDVHVNTVRRWSSDGTLKAYRLGPRGDRRFVLGDIEALLRRSPGL